MDELAEDKIIIKGISCFGYHGVLDSERRLGQPFRVDVELYLALKQAGESDDLTRTVDYGQVYRVVEKIVGGDACSLIESVAERIAQAILDRFPVNQVMVRVNKPQAPLGGIFTNVAVEIRRRRHG